MLNEKLFRQRVKLWLDEYAREHPEVDADVIRDWLSDAPIVDYDTPSDFMKEAAKEGAPTFYGWWIGRQNGSKPRDMELMAEQYATQYDEHKTAQVTPLAEGPSEPTVRVADRLVDLLRKNGDYAPLLKRIVHVEGLNDWHNPAVHGDLPVAPYGWLMADVEGLTGGHITQLVDAGAVRYAYESNQYKYFRATDVAQIQNALSRYESLQTEAAAALKNAAAVDHADWKKLWHQPCPMCAPHTLLDHASEQDLQLLQAQLDRARSGLEPNLPDAEMHCFKCECFVSRTAIFSRVVDAMSAVKRTETSGSFLENVRIAPEDEAHFREVLAEGDALDYWSQAVAPKIIGMGTVKKAILIALASLPDIADDRNRIHVLLWGDPGTAKTEMAREVLRFGGGWADHGTSDVGLTADASGGELTMGLLPVNHKSVVGIDELDKFEVGDQNGVLESMEMGEVTVNRGKFVNLRLPAETIIVATANRLERFRPELVSRFDFIIRVSVPTVQQAQDIMDDRILWWNRPKGKDTANLAKFLKWTRDYTPDIPETVRAQAKALMNDYIMMSGETRVRRLERVIRIALAIARLNHRDVVLKDFKRAIAMVQEAHTEKEAPPK